PHSDRCTHGHALQSTAIESEFRRFGNPPVSQYHRRLVLVLFLATVLVVSLCRSDRFGADQPHALTALIVATVTGCVVVTIAVTKGAFATMADRNAGLPMPEHMKEIIEVGKNIIGGGHG
ncbi:hypothetical protein, partial [Sphingomonas sp. 3F27F9]